MPGHGSEVASKGAIFIAGRIAAEASPQGLIAPHEPPTAWRLYFPADFSNIEG